MSAVELVAPDAPEAEWLAARYAGIGASEISAVLGLSPWESPFSLFWRKTNRWEIERTADMRAGQLLESAIADWWLETHDPHENLVMARAGLYRSADRPWQLATPDRLLFQACIWCGGTGRDPMRRWVEGCGGCDDGRRGDPIALLECKYIAAPSWDGWGQPGTDDIPVYYRTQVLQQMDVMGVDEVFVAALGPGGFRAYTVRRDPKDVRVLREAGAAFMARLDAGDAPDLDGHSATLATLQRLHPDLGHGDVEVPLELAEGYRRARALKACADRLISRYEARIRAALGSEFHRAVYGGRLVASRSVYARTWDDEHELAALDDGYPITDRLNPGRARTYLETSR